MQTQEPVEQVMINEEATKSSIEVYRKVTREIDIVCSSIRIGRLNKNDFKSTLEKCELWKNQIESILEDLIDPETFTDKYMTKIEKIEKFINRKNVKLILNCSFLKYFLVFLFGLGFRYFIDLLNH